MLQTDFSFRLELPSTHRFLNVAGSSVEAILQRLDDLIPIGDKVSSEVQIAMQEICANVVDHAYGQGQDGRLSIDIGVLLDEACLKIHIQDSGRAFDQDHIQDRIAVPKPDDLQEGGYGLFFATELMDEVTYRREQNQNHWTLIKILNPVPEFETADFMAKL